MVASPCETGMLHNHMDCQCVSVLPFLKNNYKSAEGNASTGLSYPGASCQICKIEGRRPTVQSVVVCGHGIRCCQMRPLDTTAVSQKITAGKPSWACPSVGATCIDKFHSYYLPKGLFGEDPVLCPTLPPPTIGVKTKCSIYQERFQWMKDNKCIPEGQPTMGAGKKRRNKQIDQR